MEVILNATLEAISLASPAGLSLPDLWQRLNEPAAAFGAATLPPTMRRALWEKLHELQEDIIAAAGAVPQGSEPIQISWDAPETASHTAAEAANIHLIASPAMQDAALGVYAARLNRFQLSLPQRQTLRILGEAKGRGALQSVLTTALGIENRNYSYVVKNLEERGLVTKCPTVLQKNGGHVTSTNLIVLTKFAPEEMTDPQARFHDGRSSTIGARPTGGRRGDGEGDFLDDDGAESSEGSDAEDDGGENNGFDDLGGLGAIGHGVSTVQSLNTYGIDAGGTTYNPPSSVAGVGGLHIVLDDDVHLRKITTLLASLPDHCLHETELKRDLGYIGKRGHRRWRRLRNILERKNCIERFKAREGLTGPVIFMVKLLRAWTGETDDEWILAALLDPLTGKLNVFGDQVAELTLDRQMLRMLAIAGPDGVTTQQFDSRLKFNIKRNEPRFKELRARFGEGNIVEQHINQGKIRLLRFTASPELLAALDSAFQGVSADGVGGSALQPPPGGYLAAVREAILVGLNEDGTNPLAKYTSTPGDGQGEDEEGDENDLVAALLAAVANTTNTAAAGPSEPAAGADDDDGGNGEEDEEGDEEEETEDVDGGAGPSSAAANKADRYAPGKRRKPPLTEMAKLRRQWIVDRVNREGLLLCSEIGSYLQLTERAVRNNPKAVRPDRKVIQRLIDAAVEANKVAVLRVTFPGVHGSLSARPQDVLAKPGTQADPEFVDQVFAAHREMQKRIRQSSTTAIVRAHEDASREMLPIVPAGNKGGGGGRSKGGKGTTGGGGAGTGTGTTAGGNQGDSGGAAAAGGSGAAAAAGGGGAAATGTGATTTGQHGPALADITLKVTIANGLIGARMQRAWKIHELAWKLLDAREGAPSQFQNPSLAAAAAEGKVFLVGHAPVSLLGGRPLDMGVYDGTPEQQATVLSTDEFWKSLTVEDFCACLGSRSTEHGLVQDFRAANKKMGELRRRELISLAGGIDALTSAKGNLTRLLDILTRMGLICAIVPFGEGGKSLTSAGAASYLFRRKIQYEEPIQILTTTTTTAGGAAGGNNDALVANNAGAGTSAAAGNIQQRNIVPSISIETKLHSFDATTVSGRNGYWLSMEYMVMCSPMAGGLRGRIGQASLLTDCFPFSKAPEAASERSWISKASIVNDQLNVLAERISTMVLPQPGYMSSSTATAGTTAGGGGTEVGAADREGQEPPRGVLTWEGAASLAQEFHVPFETVARAVSKVHVHRMRGVIGSSRRLGALGGRGGGANSASLAAARQRKNRFGFATRRKRRRGGVSDDEYTDNENEDAFGNLELGGGSGAGGGGGNGDGSQPIRQRRKKWLAQEDRQLLQAWATWLAAHGPDKILRWKYLKGRPRSILPISCKYRIQVLKANESIGPMMMRIVELAGAVHSRRVLREAAKEQERRRVTASAGAMADFAQIAEGNEGKETGVGEKRKERAVSDADGEDGGGEPDAKRVRSEGEDKEEDKDDGTDRDAAATALTANLPPLWTVSDSEDATALELVVEEIESVVRTAPSRPKESKKKSSHIPSADVGDDGEDYNLTAGGNGTTGGGGGGGTAVALGDRRGRNLLGGLGGRLLGPAARGPVIIARQFTALRQWARAAAAARANGSINTTARPPMPSVSMAMELVKSLLLTVKEKEEGVHVMSSSSSIVADAPLDASFNSALTDRFNTTVIKEAISELIRLGHITVVSPGGGGSSGVALSKRFCVEMEPLFLPGGLFSEAYAAHAELLPLGPATPAASGSKPVVKTLLPLAPHQSSSSSAGAGGVLGVHEFSGGAVAAVLSKCLTSPSSAGGVVAVGAGAPKYAELTASLPRSVRMVSTAGIATAASQQQQQQQQPGENTGAATAPAATATAAQTEDADDETEENMLRVLTNIKVSATLRPTTTSAPNSPVVSGRPATSTAAAGGTKTAAGQGTGEICIGVPCGQKLTFIDLNGTEHKLQFSSQEEVLYQPSLVASDAKLQSAAEAACKKLFTFKKIGDGKNGGKVMEQMLKSLREAGNTGLNPSDFLLSSSSNPPENESSASASCLKTIKQVEEALGALCRCGLARRITSYDSLIIVASDVPHPPLAFPPPENIATLETSLSSLNLPKQGTVQPCVDVPIRPWVDHLGRLKPSLWRALIHRAVSTVVQYPGVGGDVILQSMRVVNPQHAREVIRVLCAAGIFRTKKENNTGVGNGVNSLTKGKRKSVLAACFGDEENSQNEEEEENEQGTIENGIDGDLNMPIYGGTFFPTIEITGEASSQADSAWNFFVDPQNLWQAMEVLPPSVLVPASL